MSEQPTESTIQFDDFAKVQMRVAKVLEAFEHPKADKLMVLKVDLGTEQRQICAGIRGHYTPDQLVGRNIVVVVNLAPRMMRGLESNGMLLAASNADHTRVILLTPDADVEPGASVS
jgi:tRNA-binding protein